MAESEIAKALDPLQPDDAMAALIEIQAIILADQGILPRTPEFERFAAAYFAQLAERIHNMRQGMIAGAH